MTQPIQEPTTQRSISQGKWGENQLFRRPAPPSGAGIACLRAYRFSDPLPVSGLGTSVELWWTAWENCDTDVFEPQTIGDEMNRLDLLVPGRLTMCWGVRYERALDDTSAQMLQDDEPVFGSNTYMTLHGRDTNGANSIELSPSLDIQTFVRTYPTMDPFNSGNQFPVRFGWNCAQLSGSTEDIEFAFLDVTFEVADICEGPIES